MLCAVLSRKGLDCVIRDREYYLFDTGLAVGQMMLRATEMGLVAHAMAGFSPSKAREALGIPADMSVVTLIAFGARSAVKTANVPEEDWRSEEERPPRLAFGEFARMERY
jgi:nitroreductase